MSYKPMGEGFADPRGVFGQSNPPPKSRETLLAEILEDFIIAIRKAEMEATTRMRVDVYGLKREGPDVPAPSVERKT